MQVETINKSNLISNKKIENNSKMLNAIVEKLSPIIKDELKIKKEEYNNNKKYLNEKKEEVKNDKKHLEAEIYLYKYELIKSEILNNIWNIIQWNNNLSEKIKNDIIILLNNIDDLEIDALIKQNELLKKYINRNREE
jgi:hypothetical protein